MGLKEKKQIEKKNNKNNKLCGLCVLCGSIVNQLKEGK